MTLKVLVVDDSKLARMAVARLMDSLHPEWPVLEAANAEEALKCIHEEEPDIALLDFNMPGKDGLVLAEELYRANSPLAIAIISANQQAEVVARARAAGAVFLPKPLKEAALGAFLSAALVRQRSGTPE